MSYGASMGEWVALIGVMLGGIIGIGSQWLSARETRRGRRWDVLVESLAEVAALEEDFRNRVWEVRNKISETAVDDWDTIAHRRARASLLILAESESLRTAERTLTSAGEALGRAVRLHQDDGVVEQCWIAHKVALQSFVTTAKTAIR